MSNGSMRVAQRRKYQSDLVVTFTVIKKEVMNTPKHCLGLLIQKFIRYYTS